MPTKIYVGTEVTVNDEGFFPILSSGGGHGARARGARRASPR